MTPPAVFRSEPPARPWRLALGIGGVLWGVIAVMLLLAYVGTGAKQGQAMTAWQLLRAAVLPFLPLFLFTVLASVAMLRRPEAWLEPRRLLWAVPLVFAVVWPAMLVFEAWLYTQRAGLPPAAIVDWFKTTDPTYFWMDFVLVAIAVVIQWAMCAWLTDQQRRRALEASLLENVELRLARLQGQLEPHFLFNALNTISALVRGADRGRATAALARLSDLLRYALKASKNPWLSVADEIEFLRDYLSLQELRFSDRLEVDLHLDDEPWASLGCPPLLLQPLIENAVRHGLESHSEHCRIDLAVRIEGDDVVFQIRNPLPASGAANPGHGMGLAATRDRLALLYGAQASLSAGPEGTDFVAGVRIPCRGLE